MGNSPFTTLIVCIDKDKQYKKYESDIKNHDYIKLKYFEEINDGIKYIKGIRFQKTIIIISQDLFPEFYESFKKNEKELYVLPKIIIFNEINESYDPQKYNTTLPINDKFYNIGGIINNKDELMLLNFVDISMNKFKPEFEKNSDDRIKNEELLYQLISDKNELILPIFYSEHIKISNEEKIKECITKIFQSNKNIEPLGFIFSQLNEAGNIPISILSKFLIRAYSTHQNFSSKMNQELLNGNYNDYLPIIEILYKSVYNCYLNFEYSHKLYKFFVGKKNKWETLFDNFNKKGNKFPNAILFGHTFFSFYNDDIIFYNMIDNFNKNNSNDEILIKLILEGTKNLRNVSNNAIINKELSYFEDEKEILFFPFSCFEIKKIDKNSEKQYTLILNYLSRELFINEENKHLSKEPENEFSKLLFESGLIDKKLFIKEELKKINATQNLNVQINQSQNNQNINYNEYNEYNQYEYKNQLGNSTISINSNCNNSQLTVINQIDNNYLFSLVKMECESVIFQNNSSINNLDELKGIVQKKLIELNEGNWDVNISNKMMNNFENIDKKSVIIFRYNNFSNDFYICITKL